MTVTPQQQTSPSSGSGGSHQPTNLADILERVLDRGLIIAGDIRISLLDIELLTVKLRLLIASVDTARQLGIDWWVHDPWLSSAAMANGGNGHTEVRGGQGRPQLAAGEDGPGQRRERVGESSRERVGSE